MLRTLPYTLLLILIVLPMAPASPADEPWTFLTRVWDLSGCQLDPNGKCLPSPRPKADTDNGCEIDPSGRCRS